MESVWVVDAPIGLRVLLLFRPRESQIFLQYEFKLLEGEAVVDLPFHDHLLRTTGLEVLARGRAVDAVRAGLVAPLGSRRALLLSV